MPLLRVLATIAICDYCDTRTPHIAGTKSPLATDALTKEGWLITDTTTACPRCMPLARLTTKATA